MDYDLNDGLWWFDIRFVDDFRFCNTYILSSVHLHIRKILAPSGADNKFDQLSETISADPQELQNQNGWPKKCCVYLGGKNW